MSIINKPDHSTIGDLSNLKKVGEDLSKDEIKNYNLLEDINEHPLAKKYSVTRSKLAYAEIIKNLKPTKKYLLPGQICLFNYYEPKYKEDLEYYDKTPLVLFFGITRDTRGNIREIGLNLHYYPPFARAKILNTVYNVFKLYFQKYFNEPSNKPNTFISYHRLMHIINTNKHLAFGIKMYIPVLRGTSYVIPSKLLSTAYYTEGNFSKATLQQIFSFWRKFK